MLLMGRSGYLGAVDTDLQWVLDTGTELTSTLIINLETGLGWKGP